MSRWWWGGVHRWGREERDGVQGREEGVDGVEGAQKGGDEAQRSVDGWREEEEEVEHPWLTPDPSLLNPLTLHLCDPPPTSTTTQDLHRLPPGASTPGLFPCLCR